MENSKYEKSKRVSWYCEVNTLKGPPITKQDPV